jgi:catalase-peroxidase
MQPVIFRNFARMAMNDEETVALIAATLRKLTALDPQYIVQNPQQVVSKEQSQGWKNSYGKGNAEDRIAV